jgi:methionyl-tRNA formyltransferase
VFQPEKIRRPEAIEMLRQWPADLFVVAAFGQILPQTVLDLPRLGSINIHASLLPRWRGAAPIQAAVRAGDAETGITIMRMDAGLDTGPILTQRAIPVAPDETGASLHDKLAVLGGDLLIDTLPGYLDGSITPQPQDDAQATLAPRIRKDEGHIDWSAPAQAIDRTVRAFTPWPGTFSFWDGKLLKIVAGSVAREATAHAAPGTVVSNHGALAIATGDGLYLPTRVQLEGRAAASAAEFVNGYPQFMGAVLR